ncbi:Uncharacterised protein [Vibrio cholerae]|nr:hypothetical protein DN43_1607 [Vibrio cholerae]KFE20225.1 hypothetical protein DN39_1455 [Vibrio cholerae]CRZ46583.1 Uncharacterised protein [Vibrio cholerae]CRZ77084.1 Uncharacterised protein [Vibrio cholerae]CSA03790.1 Uncharacterised protein [Vibrio cholerae]
MRVSARLVVVGERFLTRLGQTHIAVRIHLVERTLFIHIIRRVHVVLLRDAVTDAVAIGVGRCDFAQRYTRRRAFRIVERLTLFGEDRVTVVDVSQVECDVCSVFVHAVSRFDFQDD